jgi:hypothetical protein
VGHPHRAGTSRLGVRTEDIVTVTDDGGRRSTTRIEAW